MFADYNELLDKLFNKKNMSVIFDYISDGIQVIDKDGVLIYCNRKAAMLDDINIEASLGKHITEVYPSLSIQTSTLMKVLGTGVAIINVEQTYATYKGKKITTINSTIPIRLEGDVAGALEISKNITDVKVLSEKVVDLQNKVYGGKANVALEEAVYTFDDIVTNHGDMIKLKAVARKIAPTDAPVMVYGETGTGKELLVQAIHNSSNRQGSSFIAQNCAALPATLLEGILFGTLKGSFTGSIDRPGLFELADGGTLFLDEINSMPMELQAKLLRVLQDGNLRRIGDTKTRKVDVRVIAATNIDPILAVEQGDLRRDLYYRLNTITLELPSLANRKEDLETLTAFFIRKFNDKLYRSVKGVSEEVSQMLKMYNWPGNIRELEHVIEGAMHLVEGNVIDVDHMPGFLQRYRSDKGEIEFGISGKSLNEAVKEVEVVMIRHALSVTDNNISKSAKLLEIPRQTLQYKIQKYELMP